MSDAQVEGSISFKEFLSRQESRLRAEQVAQARAKGRWVNSVIKLIEQIEEWIKASDPHHLVEVEHLFGDPDRPPTNYYVPAQLDIWVGTQKSVSGPSQSTCWDHAGSRGRGSGRARSTWRASTAVINSSAFSMMTVARSGFFATRGITNSDCSIKLASMPPWWPHFHEDDEGCVDLVRAEQEAARDDEAAGRSYVLEQFKRDGNLLGSLEVNWLIEQVSRIRQYRNRVAHGRKSADRPEPMTPSDAYDHLQAFLTHIGQAG